MFVSLLETASSTLSILLWLSSNLGKLTSPSNAVGPIKDIRLPDNSNSTRLDKPLNILASNLCFLLFAKHNSIKFCKCVWL